MKKHKRRILLFHYESSGPPPGQTVLHGNKTGKKGRKNRPLRKIKELIDFDFIYNEVKD